MLKTSLTGSPVETCSFRGRQFFIKRDDLLHRSFSGNKARKFYYYLDNHFEGINRLISYGSTQANSLYSFSALAKLKNWHFDFYVNRIPSYVKSNPKGNYRAAIENGANIIDFSTLSPNSEMPNGNIETYIKHEVIPNCTDTIFVPEGGHCKEAAYGVNMLAKEITDWAQQNNIENINIALPSGTGTTALFLQQYFIQQKLPFKVLTCACVGSDEYLKKQFFELCPTQQFHPSIINAGRKYHFGKLYDEFYAIWKELREETGIEFELLYDPLGWISLLNYLAITPNDTLPVLYIHQGGLLGNETMQPRYERKSSLKAGSNACLNASRSS